MTLTCENSNRINSYDRIVAFISGTSGPVSVVILVEVLFIPYAMQLGNVHLVTAVTLARIPHSAFLLLYVFASYLRKFCYDIGYETIPFLGYT